MINLYRWSITFYHYLLNVIKLSNWKKEANWPRNSLLQVEAATKIVTCTLLGPSILLGQSAKKKLECLLGKTEWGKWIELSREKDSLAKRPDTNKSGIKVILVISILYDWIFEPSVKISSIGGRFYGSCVYWKNTECVMLIL